jgi:alpha-tubulin suppressor-like RCC1 family protein
MHYRYERTKNLMGTLEEESTCCDGQLQSIFNLQETSDHLHDPSFVNHNKSARFNNPKKQYFSMKTFLPARLLSSIVLLLCITVSFAQTSRTNNKTSNAYRGSYQRFGTGSMAGHSFEIRNGTLWGWGNNSQGQLGDGSVTRRTTAVQIGTAANWLSVASGGYHAVAIKSDGTLWAWGRNDLGQVGNGTLTQKTTPVQIGTGTHWVSVAAGTYQTFALKSDGTLWAWGFNAFSQLGDGTTTDRNSPGQVGTATNWVKITAGDRYTVALRSDGTLWAWGYNPFGQLGDGTVLNKTAPVQVGTATDWVTVTAGGEHTLAIKSNGTLWAWGANTYGQLGDGTVAPKTSPVQIGSATNWVTLTVGTTHTLALKSDGTLWCWGRNNSGQLGDGTTVDRNAPIQIGTAANWVNVVAGGPFSLALKSDGTLWSWGNNFSGQLGDGTTVTPKSTPAQISSHVNWVSVAGGYGHTVAVKSNGTLWGWGRDQNNQLGDGSALSKSTPIQIGSATNWVSVTAGEYHTVGIKADGTLWAWGFNIYGQVGDGTTSNKTVPVQIGTGTNWASVSAGGGHTLALKTDGTLWAWGDNTWGQLGNGTVTQSTGPVQIGSATNWVSVSAGGNHSTGLKSDGSLWAWGRNAFGQLGDNTATQRNSPIQVGVAVNWINVTPGYNHTIALKSDGTLWAWGDNFYGQLGTGTTATKYAPVQIGAATNWVRVGAGLSHTTALTTDGTLWAWGQNTSGQLGDGTTTQRNAPVQISGQTDIVSIMVSFTSDHTGTISAARNKICLTGKNADRQLGDGTTTNTNTFSCNNNTCLQYTLATADAGFTQPLAGTGSRTDFQSLCSLGSAIIPGGASPVAGNVADSVWVEPGVPVTANGDPYVQRHYGITPATNAATATGTIILYFTQAEFTAFNAAPNHGLNLPVDAADAANNKANLRVIKRAGTSSNGSGLYSTYAGAVTIIVPASVVWSALNNWWEITFDVTGFSGFFVNTSISVLPLQLLNVSARLVNNDALLNWKTANEQNTSRFEIERSIDITNFTKTGNVPAANTAGADYTFTDRNITALGASVVYYRLKMIDMDGSFTYSVIIPLNIKSRSAAARMYPNPVHDVANVTISALKNESIRYSIIDPYGRVIFVNKMNVTTGNNTMNIDTRTLAAGAYTLRMRGTETNKELKFVKQ